MPARHIGLIANDTKPGARELVQSLQEAFAKHPVEILLEERTAQLIGAESPLSPSALAEKCELLVVLGGDGTILQVLNAIQSNLPPVFGINLGTLGFLTTVAGTGHSQAVEAIVSGSYELSERTLLKVDVFRRNEVVMSHRALNDAVISRGEISRLIRLHVKIDDDELTEYHADGLIVATPTGSTAYSLSAGGPVMSPESGVFVINPICPHVLTNRAMIVSDASVIEITPTDLHSEIFITLDGQAVQRIESCDVIRITKAPQRLPLATLPGMSFFEVLRQKLKWSGTAV